MRILFLDDNNRRHKEFRRNAVGHIVDRAYSAQEAIRLLSENDYDLVLLDYDLTEDPEEAWMDDYECGQVVADWLATNALGRHNCKFVIHSLAEYGPQHMLGTLRSAGLNARTQPHAWHFDPLHLI